MNCVFYIKTGRGLGRKQQFLLPAAFKQPLLADSDRAKLTKVLKVFRAKDMQPYAAVEDEGVHYMNKMLDPCDNVSSLFFELYEQMQWGIVKQNKKVDKLIMHKNIKIEWAEQCCFKHCAVHFTWTWSIKWPFLYKNKKLGPFLVILNIKICLTIIAFTPNL